MWSTSIGMSSARSRSGGELDRDDVEAVVQVLAEPAGGDRLGQVQVRRGQDPAIGADDLGAADPLEAAVLQDAEQLRLHPHGELADLVQQEGAPPWPARTAPSSAGRRR
jgi:hypothetical protein